MFRQLLVATLVGLALGAPSSNINGQLLQTLEANGIANIAISFRADTKEILRKIESSRFASRGAKISAMMTQLDALRSSTHENAIEILGTLGVAYQSFWINNMIYINGADLELVQTLAALPEVSEIREQVVAQIDEPIVSDNTINAEWGVDKIEAQQAWALPGGNNGQGVVVSNIDTGVRSTHEALRKNFRSSYGWYDPYDKTANPSDGNGHGTHTMGTLAGSNGVGVAPGAQWIACRGCSDVSCSEAALVACGQFITCPTLANGESPNCDLAPALVSNSWGGGQGSTFYDSVINSWRSAGIVPLFSQGNAGPVCGSANSPADNANVIAVGSTTREDGISSFSSRGPAVSGDVKPDVTAPGTDIRSAWSTSDSAYTTISGTSMSSPHAAGAAALLLAQNPNLSYDQIKNLLQDNAERDLRPATECGGTPADEFPNNVYGYGRINARRALESAISGF